MIVLKYESIDIEKIIAEANEVLNEAGMRDLRDELDTVPKSWYNTHKAEIYCRTDGSFSDALYPRRNLNLDEFFIEGERHHGKRT